LRVFDTRSVGVAGPARRAGRAAAPGFQGLLDAEETAETRPAAGPAPVMGLSVLLAAQAVDDVAERQARAARQGHDILDQLELVRRELVLGAVSVTRLQQIARMVRARDSAGLDAQLTDLLAEIDLRVAVELAKLGIDPGV
jgi:hypothetical protein